MPLRQPDKQHPVKGGDEVYDEVYVQRAATLTRPLNRHT
jgi:hypothetical protein